MSPAPALGMTQRTALVLLTLIFAFVVMPGAAQASTYRFWNFWTVSENSWVYSQLGPASTIPEDGSVQGWVFAATDADSASVAPSVDSTVVFEKACSDFPEVPEQKRVAFAIDSGSSDIAPEGQMPPGLELICATGEIGAHGYELLNSVTELRTENGFICAINSYPAMECSALFDPQDIQEQVQVIASESISEATSEETGSLAPLGTAAVIGLIAIAGFYFWRKRST